MQKNTLVPALAAALTLSAAALAPQVAQAQDFMVRVRALNLQSENKSDTTPALGLSVNDKTFPELDLTWFVTPQFAAELILTYPQEHDIRSNGVKIGSLKHLPPTLLGQYHFTGLGAFKPYLGAGINYTRFSNVEFDPAVVAALAPTLKKDSWGLALQAGVDYALTKNWMLNLDIKKVSLGTDVLSAGTKVGTFKVDPLLIGVGVGYRF